MSSYSDHYIKNHLGKPHEALVRGINPERQQRETPKDTTAYAFLYVALGLAAFLLFIMIYGVYRDHRIKSKERHKDKENKSKSTHRQNSKLYPSTDVKVELGNGNNNGGGGSIKSRSSNGTNLYTTGTTSAGGSVPSMTTIPEEVQPPHQDLPYSTPANHTHPVHPNVTRDLFGENKLPSFPIPHSHSRRQRQNNDKSGQQPVTYPLLTTEPQNFHTSTGNNLDSGPQRRPYPRQVSREESFPYEKYGIPPEEREPRTARVENMRPMSDFLKLGPGESFYQLDEEEYSGSGSSSGGEASPGRGGGTSALTGSGSTSTTENDHELGDLASAPLKHEFGDADTLPYDASKRGRN